MAKRHNMHAYDHGEIERLRGVPIPVKIKCGRCHKNLPPTKYSEKQLTDLRYQISKGVRELKRINCQTCTGPQVVELECTMCHKTKGLEDFAKCQRSKPDTAKCFKCTDIQVTSEPVNHDRYEDPNKTFVTPDSSAGRVPDYWSSTSSTTGSSTADDYDWSTVNGDANDNANSSRVTLSSQFQRALSITEPGPETLIDSDSSYAVGFGNGNATGDGWNDVRARSWHTRSTGTTVTGTASFDGNRYGNPSVTSRAGTQRTYASSVAERSEAGDGGPHSWAKIPRDSKPQANSARSPFVRPAGDTRREIEEAWAGSDEEDEEEDSDSDDSDGTNTIL